MAYQYSSGLTLDELLQGMQSPQPATKSFDLSSWGTKADPYSSSLAGSSVVGTAQPYTTMSGPRQIQWDGLTAPDPIEAINQAPARPTLYTDEGQAAHDPDGMSDQELIQAINTTSPQDQLKLKALIEELRTRQTAYQPTPPTEADTQKAMGDGTKVVTFPGDMGDPIKFTQYNDSAGEVRLYDDEGYIYKLQHGKPMPMGGARVKLDAQGNPLNPMTGQIANPTVANGGDSTVGSLANQSYQDALDWAIKQKQINAAINKGTFYSGGMGSDGTPITSVNDGFAGVDAALRNHTSAVRDANNGYISALNDELTGRQSNYDTYSGQKSATDAARAAALNQFTGAAGAAKAGFSSNLGAYLGETNGLMAMRQGAGWGADVATDPKMLAQQQAAMDALVQEAVAGGATQQEAIDFARQQIATGGALQKQVFDKQWGETDPHNTAAERAALDQTMRAVEDRNRGVREAAMDMLARRGLKSGDAMLAAQEAGRASTDAVQAQGILGAQGQAVLRAQQALRDAGTTAAQLRTGDQNAIGLFGNLATQKRSSDQNAQANRMQGASTMREQSDALDMFNKTGSQRAAQWQDSVAMSEAARVGNLAAQRGDARNAATTNIFGVDSDLFGAQRMTTNDQSAADRTFYGDTNDFYSGNSDISGRKRDAQVNTADNEVGDAKGILDNAGNWWGASNSLDNIDPILALIREKNVQSQVNDLTDEDKKDK